MLLWQLSRDQIVRHIYVSACKSLLKHRWLLLFELRLGSRDLNWTELLHKWLVLTLLRNTEILIKLMACNRSNIVQIAFYLILSHHSLINSLSLKPQTDLLEIDTFLVRYEEVQMFTLWLAIVLRGVQSRDKIISIVNIVVKHNCRYPISQEIIFAKVCVTALRQTWYDIKHECLVTRSLL